MGNVQKRIPFFFIGQITQKQRENFIKKYKVKIIDSETEEMVTGMAFHWYSGDHFEEMDLVRKKYPNLKLILSESCLDETGDPNYVGNLCHAPYLFHREKKRLLPQPTLDCFYHVSHFIRPGSVRIAHSVYTDKIETTAYKREDGSIAMVCLNRTEKQLPVHLRINKKTAEFTLLPQSVTTCEISDL